MTELQKKPVVKYYVILHILFILYSLYALMCKFASQEAFLSLKFIVFYGSALLVMFIYAIFWQSILKVLPLNVAFSNKAAVIIWGMIWGLLFFGEQITIGKIGGAVLVIIGIIMVVNDGK